MNDDAILSELETFSDDKKADELHEFIELDSEADSEVRRESIVSFIRSMASVE